MKELIAIIGLGYVGLPLAVEFGKKRRVIGFDISRTRIAELEQGIDKTLEIKEIEAVTRLKAEENNISVEDRLKLIAENRMLIEAETNLLKLKMVANRYKNTSVNQEGKFLFMNIILV